MHQESFGLVSCMGLGEAQGELFNSAFHETQRRHSSASPFFKHADMTVKR